MRARSILSVFFILLFSLAVFPIDPFKVKTVSASVSESEYRGFCPHRFVFSGRIATNRGGTVRYRWLRSDGAAGGEESLVFDTAGTKTVSASWQLGAAMGTYRDRWMRIEILAPNSLLSNKAVFDLECIPQFRAERKIYTVSGRLICYAGQAAFLDALVGCQLKVSLEGGGRVVKEQVVDLTRDGINGYSLVLIDAPGTYLLSVRPVHLTEKMIWQRTEPASYTVELTEASPDAVNMNFTYYYGLSGML